MASAPQRSGFTLIELLVVVFIVGILTVFAIPQYYKVVEKSRVAEAISSLNDLRGAQQRYQASYGAYCAGDPSGSLAAACPGWALPPLSLRSFASAAMATTAAPSWNIVLTRAGTLPPLYGAYRITYAIVSDAAPALSCVDGDGGTKCQTDLMPE